MSTGSDRARRALFGGLLLGVAASALGGCRAAWPPEVVPKGRPWVHPAELLARISPRKRQLWVCSYVGQPVANGQPLDGTFADCEAAIAGGADAVLLVNELMPEGVKQTQFSSYAELEAAIVAVRARFPDLKLGVNWLGDDDADPYGWRGGFRLAREHGLCVVWTDVSGIDLIREAPPESLHEIAAARPPGVFYCSGIHMKYTHPLDPEKTIEESALQAMGWLDGVIVTGPKTGVSSDPEVVKRARSVLGTYPLGVASGVTAENVGAIRDLVDFYIVHTGIQEQHRIVAEKVRALRAALDR